MSTTTRLISYRDSLSMPENPFVEIVHGANRIIPPATLLQNYIIEVLAETVRCELDPREYHVTCPVKDRNKVGTMVYAAAPDPNSRTTQIFINLADNQASDVRGSHPSAVAGDSMAVVQ